MAAFQQRLEDREIGLAHAELVDVGERAILVEHAQHDLLAEDPGQRAEPQIDGPPVGVDLHPPVLRQAPFRDVQIGHHLEPRDQGRMHVEGGLHDLIQDSVDAKPDPRVAPGGLDVDVAGPVLHGALDESVEKVDHRATRGHLVDGRVVVQLTLLDDLEVARHVELPDEVAQVVVLAIGAVDGFEDGRGASEHRSHLRGAELGHGIEAGQGLRVGGGEEDDPSHLEQRSYPQPAGRLDRDETHDLRVVDPGAQAHVRQPELLGQHLEQGFLAEYAFLDQDLSDPPAGLLLLGNRLGHHVLGREPPCHQDLAELAPQKRLRARHRHRCRHLLLVGHAALQLDARAHPGDAHRVLHVRARVRDSQHATQSR